MTSVSCRIYGKPAMAISGVVIKSPGARRMRWLEVAQFVEKPGLGNRSAYVASGDTTETAYVSVPRRRYLKS
ncbi:hypothetical protein KCP78_09730 [Salmonella enterica subsp. enterica]|nr:hypothetical protein KCP78_09730 [Salmonella enterica subsp. enterica]